MSKTSKIFQKVPVRIQNYSGFDMSHYNLGTLTCGTLVPVLTEPLMPGDKISLGTLAQLDLPPLATNFYGRVDFKMEAFFVPYRILMQQWEKFMKFSNSRPGYTPGVQTADYQNLPTLRIPAKFAGRGSLADYLGCKKNFASTDTGYIDFNNPLPFLAYHKIYDCWYRDKILQKPVFEETSPATLTSDLYLRNLPWFSLPCEYTVGQDESDTLSIPSINGKTNGSSFATLIANSKFGDGHLVWDLRQRNFHKDYFTSSTPEPQAGDPVQLKFDISGGASGEEPPFEVTGSGSFTIAALRAANSLQKFIERNNLAGDDYADQIQANFGVRPSDAAINYPIYLGSQSFDVYNRSIFQSGNGALETGAPTTNNPFKNIGAEYGKASSFGKGSLVDSFECTEFGVLMVMGSLVPHSFYSTGCRRYLYDNDISDFPFPLLASVGDQPVYKGEVAVDSYSLSGTMPKETFGYQGRYSHLKYHDDEVHGILSDGCTLENFAIQRSFESASVELGSTFIQIPTTLLDQVMAASTGLSEFSAWYQLFFDFKKASKLPVYCIPTLGDEPDTHTEVIDKGGKRL